MAVEKRRIDDPYESNPHIKAFLDKKLPRATPPALGIPNCFRPSTVASIKQLRSQGHPKELINKYILGGYVYTCLLHMIVISNDVSKYSKFNTDADTLLVSVHMSYPEGTLLPFGQKWEGEYKCPDGDKLVGTVPLSEAELGERHMRYYPNPNQDPKLQGCDCYVNTSSGCRYFMGCEGYTVRRVGDYLSSKNLLRPILPFIQTGEYVTIWQWHVKQKVKYNMLTKKGQDLQWKAKKRAEARVVTNEGAATAIHCAKQVSSVLDDMLDVYVQMGWPPKAQRSSWAEWNLAQHWAGDSELEIQRKEENLSWAAVANDISPDKMEDFRAKMVPIQYFGIMINTQQMYDERAKKQYLMGFHGG